MSKVKKLDADQEKQITAALTKVADLVRDGNSPDDAIVKVATEKKLPAGYVRLMTNAYNTGQSIGNIRNGETLVEKASSFPLANAVNVLERLFPSAVKTASEIQQATDVSDDYTLSPVYWIQRRDAQEKRADIKSVQENKVAAYPGIADKPGRKAVNKIHKLRKEAEQKRLDTIAAGYRVTGSINELTNYFRKVGHVPMDTAKKYCVAILGDRAGNVLDKAATQAGKLSKTAAHHDPDHVVDWEAAPYCLVKESLNAVDAYITVKDIMDNFEKEAEADAVEIARPFCQPAGKSVITGSVWDRQSQIKTGGAMPFVLGYGAASGVSEFMSPIAKQMFPPKEDELASVKKKLEAPSHTNKIQAIRTRAMLDDMMANDSVISGYEPDEILQAFNHLSELAPNAVTSSNMLAKSLMRKYLEQGQILDTFDIDQLLSAENKIKTNSGRGVSASNEPSAFKR